MCKASPLFLPLERNPLEKKMKRILCRCCDLSLGNTEIALNLKLRGRAVGTFFCLRCLAERMESAPEELSQLAWFFKENGCELFSRQYVDDSKSFQNF